jgi:hypothetical protein
MYRSCRAVLGKFGKDYLRGPNEAEIARIMAQNATRGFSGMLVLVMEELYVCLAKFVQRHHRQCSVVLEAMANHERHDRIA